ncbi:glycosyltransferase family 4 protein [Flavobacterium sp. WC2429]|uniref:Glycosyltransferase family 4 protein n=1 Tax=Flavobacterium sp. WC2429 TaxID=3234140 RepID=A0AB39WMY3_9FLAO
MKILFLSHKFYPEIGGIEVNSEILANQFVALGAEVHLLTWSEYVGEKIFPFKVIRNPDLSTLLKEHRWADVVFENNPSLKLSWPLLFFRKPHVVAIRTWISRMDGNLAFPDKIKLLWLKKASAVIAVSEEVRILSFAKAIVIGNPYRSSLFKITNTNQRTKDFVFLGRLVSDKGADLAVALLKKLHETAGDFKRYKELSLTIIGDGPEKERLIQLVKANNLSNYVHFTGMLQGDTLTSCLNEHKYLLAPSRWKEPFGNIALEGMACGCLPFVSDGGGLIDAVGNAGVVFERNNIDSFYEQVRELLESPEKETLLRLNSSGHLLKHQPEYVAQLYYDLIFKAYNSKSI